MLIVIYFVLALLEIVGEYHQYAILIYSTKPLLMVVLGYWFYQQTVLHAHKSYRKWLLLSLGFAFGGDTFLMLLPYSEHFFLLGLGSFLIGQLCYSVAFIQSIRRSDQTANIGFRIMFLFFFAIFYIVLMRSLFDQLGEFLVPVLVYGLAICVMGVSAAWRLQKVSGTSFVWVFSGALLFVISDTIIAINKFLYNEHFWNAQVLIMLTYVVAQYLIAKGSVIYLTTSESDV